MKVIHSIAFRAAVLGTLLWISQSAASAALLNFEDRDGINNEVEDGYRGFSWLNVLSTDRTRGDYIGTGYYNGATSGDNVAYNGYGDLGGFSRDAQFNFNSVNLTSAFTPQSVVFLGYIDRAVAYSKIVDLTTQPLFVDFGWLNVTSVTFETTGGLKQQVVLDDVRITNVTAVPESSTWAMMIIGFGMIGYTARRRRTTFKVRPAKS